MILVPVKNLKTAKQRLASGMEQSARTELAQAMLQDVIEALSGYEVSLVTSDSFAVELATNSGFTVIHDESNLSETDAIEMATQVCESRGIRTTLGVH